MICQEVLSGQQACLPLGTAVSGDAALAVVDDMCSRSSSSTQQAAAHGFMTSLLLGLTVFAVSSCCRLRGGSPACAACM
jgi:hypothetical protein